MTIQGSIPRILGKFGQQPSGPTLVIVAGLHGNEPAGYMAAQRVIARLEELLPPFVGELSFLVGNRAALQAGVRYLDLDMNRLWAGDNLALVRSGRVESSGPAELCEAIDLMAAVKECATGSRLYVLDLHTTSGESPPFGVLADSLQNRRFVRSLNVPVILGLEEQLDGTLLSVLEADGWIAANCEGGRHEDPRSVDNLEAAIWMAISASGVLLEPALVPEIVAAGKYLAKVRKGLSRVNEVRYRHPVTPSDKFVMDTGYSSFDRVVAGQEIASDKNGRIGATETGNLLMPLYQSQGSDGFFVMRPVNRFWLGLSGVLRRLGAPAFLPLLPGVTRDPSQTDVFLVDRKTARWFALEVVHLLGFRRERVKGDLLVVSRR